MAVPKRMAVVGLFVLGSLYVIRSRPLSRHLSPFHLRTRCADLSISVCIAGIIRLPFLSELQVSDATYTSSSVGVWINVECNIGILSACLPILRPLFSTKYSSSPISRLTRMIRTLTNSRFSTSSRENLTTDPEKGGSEPSSDATVAEGLKWRNDSTAGGGWRWSRNNSYSTSDVISPVHAKSPAEPVGSRRTIPLGERERKHRTWYTAAAEMLPEMDSQRRWSRKAIDTDQIPRYRDDEEKRIQKEEATAGGEDKRRNNSNAGGASEPKPEKEQERSRKSSRGRLQVSSANSAKASRRSSVGRTRDTWNLMPSVLLWDRGSLVRAVNLR